MRLQQGFAIDEMGFGAKLHSSSREARMSALGQKRTFQVIRSMSALPPKADVALHRSECPLCAKSRHWPRPRYPANGSMHLDAHRRIDFAQ
jgi:hypothetical protein